MNTRIQGYLNLHSSGHHTKVLVKIKGFEAVVMSNVWYYDEKELKQAEQHKEGEGTRNRRHRNLRILSRFLEGLEMQRIPIILHWGSKAGSFDSINWKDSMWNRLWLIICWWESRFLNKNLWYWLVFRVQWWISYSFGRVEGWKWEKKWEYNWRLENLLYLRLTA